MPDTEISEFLFPSQLVRSTGSSGRVGQLLHARGVARGAVFVVADRVVHENGLTSALLEGLSEAGYEPRLFAEIAGEPSLDIVEKAAAMANEAHAVAFIGFGGGSALDTAKLATYHVASGTSMQGLRGPIPAVPDFGPLVLVPTTVGTGAEATRVAMFSVDGAKRAVLSPQFVPSIAVLDGNLVSKLPAEVVAATALDALSHAIESMMSTTSNELTWSLAGEAAQRIFARLPAAYGGDVSARSELLYASFLAGASLNAGVVLGHSMSYVLASRHHLAHGVGCALALPFCLAYNQRMPAREGEALAAAVLKKPNVTLRDLADAVHDLTRVVGLPTDLAKYGTAEHEVQALADSLIRDYPRPTNPVPLDSARLARLFSHLRTGDLSGAWTAMGDLS
ncbi:iron-containing alcohol dehydrogenase family protein [Rhodococcus sp. NPDC057014]|uniref:iron-containing alcohol dehydrogenase family protein n=1 Tax=Rhodococcus sp. NPDC057014 TaxID=3346000 RepID=UPI003635DAE0